MTTVWTPLKKPPHPKDVCALSSDARRVLQALRTAYLKKCVEQRHRLYDRSASQQTPHYRTSQTSQQDTDTQRQHIKQELCTSDIPASPPLCVDYMLDDNSNTPVIDSSPRQSSMSHIQNDNTAVLSSSQKQSSMSHIQNDNTAVLTSSQKQSSISHIQNDITAVISSSQKQNSISQLDNVIASSLSSIKQDITSSPKQSSVSPIQNDNTVVGTSSVRQLSNVTHDNNSTTDVCTVSKNHATNCQIPSLELMNTPSLTQKPSSHQSDTENIDGASLHPSCADFSAGSVETIKSSSCSTLKPSSHESDIENRDVGSSLRPTCADFSARSCKTIKSSSCSTLKPTLHESDIENRDVGSSFFPTCADFSARSVETIKSNSCDARSPSMLKGEDNGREQLKCKAQNSAIEKDVCCSDMEQQKLLSEDCPTPAHPSPTHPSRQLEINSLHTVRKRKNISSAVQGSAKKLHAAFQTPFKDAGQSKSRHSSDDTSDRCTREKKKCEQKVASSTSFKDSFTNLTKLSSDNDKSLIEERIKNAVEIVMTLVYKDKSSQLRESNQVKSSRVDDTAEGIAACIYHHKATAEPKEPTEGGVDSLDQCYVLFPLGGDGHKEWASEIFLEMMRTDVRKICFDTQELMHYTITQYKLQPYQVCCQWQLLDPKTAGWLLDPDNPPITFSDVLQICRDLNKQSLQSLNSECKVHPMCKDLTLLSWCMKVLYKSLQKKQLWDLFMSVETKLTPILAAMEVQGIRVDTKVLKTYGSKLKARIHDLESEAHKAAGCSFQVSSHVQLRQILFDQLKLDQKLQGQKLARTNVQNLKSTSEAVLSKLQDLHPLPKIVLQYRQLMKLNSTYVDGLLEFVNNESLHTSWEQTSASTGRVQSTSPNIQNIPKQAITIETTKTKDDGLKTNEGEAFTIFAREPFVSQSGWTLIAADFQSIELRLLAHMSGDRVLLKVFNNKNCLDVFVELASEWLGMKPSEVTTSDREKTKRIVYSVIYGVGPERLAETLGITKDEAKSFMKSFLNKFKGVSSFSHRCVTTCQRHNGEVRTIFNRLRLIPNINSNNFHARSYAERQAVNFVVQGSAADICKIAMIQLMHKLSTLSHLQARLLVQIHDELLLEVPDEHVEEVKAILKDVMEATGTLCGQKVSLKVPLPISVSQGKSWGHLVTS